MIRLLVWEHCRSRLRASAWSKQELRSTVISDCPGPRELPPSPYVSLFVPRLVPLLGGQTSCRHKWGQVTRMPPPPYPPRHQPTYPHPDQISWNKYTSLWEKNIQTMFAKTHIKSWSVVRGMPPYTYQLWFWQMISMVCINMYISGAGKACLFIYIHLMCTNIPPHICQFWYTDALFGPVKSMPYSRQNTQNLNI